jgi:hypothetical protein
MVISNNCEGRSDDTLWSEINRTQALVLGFFFAVWIALTGLLVSAPEIYARSLGLTRGDARAAEAVFFVALSGFIALLFIGVVRRWRWGFWLILVAFLAGLLRVPTMALQLAGYLQADGPIWYVVFQGVLGVVQFLIGIAMLVGYRKSGYWGRF